MAVYGLDFYGLSKYGTTQVAALSVAPFLATQVDHGAVLLSWQVPATSLYTKMRLVRNPRGFSSNQDDGTILMDLDLTTTGASSSYYDTGLAEATFYYYTVWLGTATPDYNATFTYSIGDQVIASGITYRSLVDNNINNTPASSPTFWSVITATTEWVRAGDIGTLIVADYGFTDFMWDNTPPSYKVADGRDLTDETKTNDSLYKFLSVFGFHFDMLRTEYDQLFYLNDPDNVQYKYLQDLGRQFGVEPEPAISPRLARIRVRENATIARERGTALGLQNLINVTTGWDATISYTANLLLSDDQASFVHPIYPDWSAAVNYAAGMRVKYANYFFEAKPGGAYGDAQKPDPTGTNTWWTRLTNNNLPVDSTNPLYNPLTGGVSTWEMFNTSTGAKTGNANLLLYTGVQSPLTSLENTANVVRVANATGGTIDMGIRSVARLSADATAFDRGQVTKDGIPIEVPNQWDSETDYSIGDIVLYNNNRYEARVNSPSGAPTGRVNMNTEWKITEKSGNNSFTDEYIVSMYLGIPSGGTGILAAPFIEWWDDAGLRLTNMITDTSAAAMGRVDTFDFPIPGGDFAGTFPTAPFSLNDQPTNPTGSPSVWGATWTLVPSDAEWRKLNGVAYALSAAGIHSAVVTAPTANHMVYVTLRKPVVSPHTKQGILFRYTDANNHWRATRTGLEKINAGVLTTPATWTALPDDTRYFVECNGTAIKVFRYLPYSNSLGIQKEQLASITDSFNQSATGVGIFVI